MFMAGKTACILNANSTGDIVPLFLKDLQDEKGKIAPALRENECPPVRSTGVPK